MALNENLAKLLDMQLVQNAEKSDDGSQIVYKLSGEGEARIKFNYFGTDLTIGLNTQADHQVKLFVDGDLISEQTNPSEMASSGLSSGNHYVDLFITGTSDFSISNLDVTAKMYSSVDYTLGKLLRNATFENAESVVDDMGKIVVYPDGSGKVAIKFNFSGENYEIDFETSGKDYHKFLLDGELYNEDWGSAVEWVGGDSGDHYTEIIIDASEPFTISRFVGSPKPYLIPFQFRDIVVQLQEVRNDLQSVKNAVKQIEVGDVSLSADLTSTNEKIEVTNTKIASLDGKMTTLNDNFDKLLGHFA